MLGYLELVTRTPSAVGPDDVAPLRDAGLSDEAVRQALYVAFIFNIMDRLADSFDFYIPTEKGHRRNGQLLHKVGYRIASLPG